MQVKVFNSCVHILTLGRRWRGWGRRQGKVVRLSCVCCSPAMGWGDVHWGHIWKPSRGGKHHGQGRNFAAQRRCLPHLILACIHGARGHQHRKVGPVGVGAAGAPIRQCIPPNGNGVSRGRGGGGSRRAGAGAGAGTATGVGGGPFGGSRQRIDTGRSGGSTCGSGNSNRAGRGSRCREGTQGRRRFPPSTVGGARREKSCNSSTP